MNFLKDNSGFKNYFAQDLLKRGNVTAIKISKDDVPCLPGDGRVSRVEHWPRLVSSPDKPRYLARPQRRISAPTMR